MKIELAILITLYPSLISALLPTNHMTGSGYQQIKFPSILDPSWLHLYGALNL